MQFLSINYSIGKRYFVETNVVKQLVRTALKEAKVGRGKDINVVFQDNHIWIELTIIPRANKKYEDIFPLIKVMIEEKIENILNFRPTNIKMKLEVN